MYVLCVNVNQSRTSDATTAVRHCYCPLYTCSHSHHGFHHEEQWSSLLVCVFERSARAERNARDCTRRGTAHSLPLLLLPAVPFDLMMRSFFGSSRLHKSTISLAHCRTTRCLANISSRSITAEITRASSPHRLLAVHQEHAKAFNDIHLSACWSRVSKLAKQHQQDDAQLLTRLREQSLAMIREGCLSSRALSNIAHALAVRSPLPPEPWGEMWDAIARSATRRVDDFNEQEMCNLAWAFSSAQRASSPAGRDLFNAVSEAGSRRAARFTPLDLSLLAWAFARAQQPAPHLFDALEEVAIRSATKFTPLHLFNLTWAYSTLGHPAPRLYGALAHAGAVMAADFEPHQAALTAWAYANAGHPAPELFDALAERQLPNKATADYDSLAIWVWAYATAQHPSPKLFAAVAEIVVETTSCQIRDGKLAMAPVDVANVAWAYAVTDEAAPPALFDSLAQQALARLDRFETRPLAKLAWACAAVEYSPSEAFASGLAERFESMSWEIDRDREELRQLHQWQLWFVEQQRAAPFSPHLSALCLDSFVLGASEHGTLIPGGTRVTRFQRQVTDGLAALGLRPEPEVVTSSGYTLDALVHWKGERVGVEADGPHHFRARTHVPTASTQLKRRQVRALGEMLCPIPWWEWNACGSDVQQQGEYLRAALDRTVAEAGARRVVPKWPWATKECG